MTKATVKTAAPASVATTAQIASMLTKGFSKFIKAAVAANVAGAKASHTLEDDIRDAAIAAGPVNASGYAKRFAAVINGQIEAANKAGAIADSVVNVYKVRFKVWFIGHSNKLVHPKGDDVGANVYYNDMKATLISKKLMDASTKGRKASAPVTPAQTTATPVAAPKVTTEALTGEVLAPAPNKPTHVEARAQYLNAAAFLMGGDKYAEALCLMIAQDKTRLTKALDAFMAEHEAASKVAA